MRGTDAAFIGYLLGYAEVGETRPLFDDIFEGVDVGWIVGFMP